ncbi:MAG TPA: farnesyl diphosphate synthase [Candidatus Polarisedimenticolia bacterium]|nr:farnesyl diphosphate synthase [Candidatus Polarisedimenticolia bacterium]
MSARRGAAASSGSPESGAREPIDRRLAELLDGHAGAPPRLMEALRYALLGGGKRLRPRLVLASAAAVSARRFSPAGPAGSRLLTAACAVEMIHTFSLIHDDLPALDDDDLRRGRPSLHVRFDEATAILAGDALLNLAYETLLALDAPAGTRLRAAGEIASAVGLRGMIAGQVLDLEAEGSPAEAAALHRLHSLKTGALITASCRVGGILAGASAASLRSLTAYGQRLGLAFQIVDDILDVEGSSQELGKSPGKDARAKKATFPALWGLAESRRRAAELAFAACEAIAPLGRRASDLAAIARGMPARRA